MANINKNRTRKDEKKRMYILLISLIVVLSMLLSGLVFFNSDQGSGQQQVPDEPNASYNGFSMVPLVANSSIYVQVVKVQPELVAVPDSPCLSNRQIGWVYNISMPSILAVSFDVANPYKTAQNDLCGSFSFFRFQVDNLSADTISGINLELDNRIGNHMLRASYIGLLPVNISGPNTDQVPVIGSLDIKEGEIAEILLFQRPEDSSVFALERARIPIGPIFSAKVLDETDLIVSGVADIDFDAGILSDDLKASVRVSAPRFIVNQSLDNETIMNISSIQGVSATKLENTSEISFNSSGRNVSGFLEEKNLTYTIQNGSISLQMPLNTTRNAAREALSGTNAKDIEVYKSGFVEMAGTVILNGRLVQVADAKNLSAVLDYEAKIGESVNVSLSAFSFGDQVYVFGAQQVST